MGATGKNKGHQKGEVGRLLKQVKEDWKEFRKNVAEEYVTFREEWAEKFNDLNSRFQKITMASAQQFAGLAANQDLHGTVLEKLDVNVQVISKMVKDIYGRLEQVDVLMGKSEVDFKHDFSPSEMEEIKKTRDKVFQDVMTACFELVNEERKAAIEQRRKEAEEQQKEAEEAEKAKSEAERAEAALQEAEAPALVGVSEEHGSDIPEGAEVFGG